MSLTTVEKVSLDARFVLLPRSFAPSLKHDIDNVVRKLELAPCLPETLQASRRILGASLGVVDPVGSEGTAGRPYEVEAVDCQSACVLVWDTILD